MTLIKNYEELATTTQRSDAVKIIEAGLAAIDTATVLEEQCTVVDNVLHIDGKTYHLDSYEHIYIIGFGKVSCTAARTLERIFDGNVREGAVVGVKEQVCAIVDTYAGTHPLPSSVNYTATKHIQDIAERATERDLVVVVVSGGGSALLCGSMAECNQGVKLFKTFLSSGGTIEELNVVRKHISTLKGGGLAAVLNPATVIGLVFSDVPGGDMTAVASGPTYFDSTTKDDAAAIIEQYKLGEFTLVETPKDESLFARVHNVPMVTNMRATQTMRDTAASLGYDASILTTTHYATPEETAAVVTEHTSPQTAVILGGETRVSVPEDCIGKGGRNDYLALWTLSDLQPGQLFASVATDGKDNTDAAGALVDEQTRLAAKEKNITPQDYTECLNAYPFFETVGGHIITGLLESNVSDVMLLLNEPRAVPALHVSTNKIVDITGTVIKDSRQQPTISVTVHTDDARGTFSVPSGASTGAKEVHALAAKEAVRQLRQVIAPTLKGCSIDDQEKIDSTLHALDDSETFGTIGGNTALGVSVAAHTAAAATRAIKSWQRIEELFSESPQAAAPRLFINLINGGSHADRGSQIQEHQIIPETDNVHEAFRVACAIQRATRDILRETYTAKQIGIGDEGGFMIPAGSLEESFTVLQHAINTCESSCPVSLGTDIAASSFIKGDTYTLEGATYTSAELVRRLTALCAQFPALRYVEDPADENDLASFAAFLAANPNTLVIGDDLTTTNQVQLQKAVEAHAINGIIIKPNQIGTLSDTLATMRYAYQHAVSCIVSHRSGETMDTFIADLAYGTKCFGMKAGAPTAKERLAKYQRLLAIVS